MEALLLFALFCIGIKSPNAVPLREFGMGGDDGDIPSRMYFDLFKRAIDNVQSNLERIDNKMNQNRVIHGIDKVQSGLEKIGNKMDRNRVIHGIDRVQSGLEKIGNKMDQKIIDDMYDVLTLPQKFVRNYFKAPDQMFYGYFVFDNSPDASATDSDLPNLSEFVQFVPIFGGDLVSAMSNERDSENGGGGFFHAKSNLVNSRSGLYSNMYDIPTSSPSDSREKAIRMYLLGSAIAKAFASDPTTTTKFSRDPASKEGGFLRRRSDLEVSRSIPFSKIYNIPTSSPSDSSAKAIRKYLFGSALAKALASGSAPTTEVSTAPASKEDFPDLSPLASNTKDAGLNLNGFAPAYAPAPGFAPAYAPAPGFAPAYAPASGSYPTAKDSSAPDSKEGFAKFTNVLSAPVPLEGPDSIENGPNGPGPVEGPDADGKGPSAPVPAEGSATTAKDSSAPSSSEGSATTAFGPSVPALVEGSATTAKDSSTPTAAEAFRIGSVITTKDSSAPANDEGSATTAKASTEGSAATAKGTITTPKTEGSATTTEISSTPASATGSATTAKISSTPTSAEGSTTPAVATSSSAPEGSATTAMDSSTTSLAEGAATTAKDSSTPANAEESTTIAEATSTPAGSTTNAEDITTPAPAEATTTAADVTTTPAPADDSGGFLLGLL